MNTMQVHKIIECRIINQGHTELLLQSFTQKNTVKAWHMHDLSKNTSSLTSKEKARHEDSIKKAIHDFDFR